jgi:hypothetical protein
MTDTLIYKYTNDKGQWDAYYLRKSGTIHMKGSGGRFARLITPDSLVNLIRLKIWSGKEYLNMTALHHATGVVYV